MARLTLIDTLLTILIIRLRQTSNGWLEHAYHAIIMFKPTLNIGVGFEHYHCMIRIITIVILSQIIEIWKNLEDLL